MLVGYMLVWILVIVTYAVEAALAVSSVGGLVVFFAYLADGSFNMVPLGMSLVGFGGAILFIFACIGATKVTIKLSKKIFTGIKTSIIRKGAK